MVVGEMGIDKTTLCEQIATYTTVVGGQSLTGHCFEEGLSSIPYIPFSEILLAYASTVDTETLKQQVGANAGDIARIVPEIGHELGVEPSTMADPDEDRYRLMRAVSNFLQNIAASQPLLVVLEDLHDADSSTLEMLNYLAHNVAGSRLMLMGTYRHTEITRAHPLSNVLVQLRRVNEYTNLQLKGLGNSEVHRMLTNIVDRDVPWSLAETICQQTEGNSLFVQEVIRDLVEEGAILNDPDEESETSSLARVVAINIPQGLRDVISRRLSRLSPECNHALSVGAVIGREFRLDVLLRMLDMTEDEMFVALEEAQSVAVIQESSGTGPILSFRFNHSFFRQTLYDDLFTPRRIRLHRQIGEILEDVYTGSIERHAREISEHFSHSSDQETLHKALNYTRMAAEDAISMSAYGEAVRLFTHALDIHEMVGPGEPAERCHLMLSLGSAMISAGEPLRTAEQIAPDALKLAQSLDDNDLASQSCELALEGLWRYGTALMVGTHQYRNWAELADTYATPNTPARVHADIAMAGVRASEGRTSEEWVLRHQALELARDLNNPEVLFRAVYACLWPGPQQQQSHKVTLATEFARHSRTGLSSRTLGLFLWRCGCVFLDSGRRPDAERAWQEMSDLADQTGDAFASLWKLAAEATLALLDGRHEDAVTLGTTMGLTAEDLGAEVFGIQWRQFLTSRSLVHLGRAEEALQGSTEPSGVVLSSPPEPEEVLLLAHLGRSEEAQTALGQLMSNETSETVEDLTPAWLLTRILETAVVLEDKAVASVISFRLANSAELATVDLAFTCVARQLGAAAVLLGNSDEALAYFNQALDIATRVQFRPEVALTQLQLAELLVTYHRDRREEARSYLASALTELDAMNMQPSLDRAAALQERIASLDSRSPAFPDGLTRREVEVLSLIAGGRTNQNIADELYISPHTVIRHVSNIFGKISVSNRAEATTYAHRNNLLPEA
jgi:DNA-binding CsgD family transcriptional regulator